MLPKISDVFRALRHSVTLNLRKSLGRDCQDRSDSGKAGETRCGVVFDYHDPRRLQKVCPHLLQIKGQWRCGVDKGAIRAFWRRSLGFWGGVLLTVYLIGAFVLFGMLRLTHAPVGVFDTIWPGRWHYVSIARSNQFYAEAMKSLEAGNVGAAQVAASSSYQSYKNYEAGLLLVHLQDLSGTADQRLFSDLIQDFPEHAAEVRLLWARSLLMGNDRKRLYDLCRQQLKEGQELTWMRLYAISVADRLAEQMKQDARDVPALREVSEVLDGRRGPRTASEAYLLLACGRREPETVQKTLPLLPESLRFTEGLYYLSQRQSGYHTTAFREYLKQADAQPVLALYLLAHPQERFLLDLGDAAENPKSVFPILFLACMKQDLAEAGRYLQDIYKKKAGTDAMLMEIQAKPAPATFLKSLTGLSIDCLLAYYEPDAYHY